MNKTVIVIGASGGIGRQVAKDLLEEGYSVIGTYANTPIDNTNISSFHLNLLSRDSIKSFVEEIKSIGTLIYGIINCSGIADYEGEDIEKDIEVWDRTIAINLTSNYILAKYFERILEEKGRFIMISSTDAVYGGSITASYSASKAGVNSLTKSLCLVLKNKMISVNSIAPGWVNTRMIQDSGEDFLKQVADINPLKRIAEPKDISNLVKFLLKPESEYINGQVITVDGGYTNQDPTLLIEENTV